MNIIKGGWNPGKPKDSSSGSGGSKWMPTVPGGDRITGKVNGVLGREKRDPAAIDRAHNHNSTPLSSLVDPSQFAPPPKHKGWYGDQGGQQQLGAPPAQQQLEYYPQDQQQYQQQAQPQYQQQVQPQYQQQGQPQYQQQVQPQYQQQVQPQYQQQVQPQYQQQVQPQYQQQGQPQYQQQVQPQYQQQGQPQYQQQAQPQYQQQYQQPQSQALTRPGPAIPGRSQKQEEAPLPPRELRPGPDGYADTSKPSVPSYNNGPPQPLPARNPAGVQVKPWEPGQKKERPLTFGGGAAHGQLSAAERYQQRTRNYGGGASSPGWNAPGQTAVAPPPAQSQAYQQPQPQYQQPQYQEGYEEPPPPPEPYQIDSTGIDTSQFAPPPKFLAGQAAAPAAQSPRAMPTPRAGARAGASAYPPPPSGVGATKKPAPPPRLPARQTEYPDENTPPAPPPYAPTPEPEAVYEAPAPRAQPQAQAKPLPGINNNNQLSELQARFSRMGRSNDGQQASQQDDIGAAAAPASKKAPPPKPVKKVGIAGAGGVASPPPPQGGAGAPPPVPLASRPTFK